MNPISSIKNQYRGLNPHLHGIWLAQSSWGSFHTMQIAYLLSGLRASLRTMGYTAEAEKSLQIRRLDQPSGGQRRSDVVIYDLDPVRSFQSSVYPSSSETLTVAEVLDENEIDEKPYQAVVIYERLPEIGRRGEPVVWIELLSPTNKGEGDDADTYRRKRRQILDSGLVFVELDYLHETPSTFRTISADHPYHIVVLDPRPTINRGPAVIKGFSVDEPIPSAMIPLNADDKLAFDFNVPYQKMFEESYFGDDVDYRQLPQDFDRYNQNDQQRILCRMIAVLEAAQSGTDLDASAPLPVELLPLEPALSRFRALT